MVHKELQTRMLYLTRYAKTTGRPGGRRLYNFLSRSFYRPYMSVDCYAAARNFTNCARNCVYLRQHDKPTKTFPAFTALEFVAIEILGVLVETPRRHKYLLVILVRFS